MVYDFEELKDQLEYEIEQQTEFGLDKPVILSSIEVSEISNLILEKNKEIEHIFNMEPSIVITKRDDDFYDWSDFYNQLIDVIGWYKMNPLIKMFSPIN